MFEEYKNFMDQQHPKENISAFYEGSQPAPVKKLPAYKKILIAATCICLLIPTAVLAAENIFDVSIVRIGPRKDLEGNDVIGYNIDFVTAKEIPLGEIGEKWRYLEEGVEPRYETWQEMQADLGYDLLDNPVLEQEYDAARALKTFDMTFRDQGVPCTNLFRAYEGQLWSFSPGASYKKDGFKVTLSADALVEHPNIPEDVKGVFTTVQYMLDNEEDLEHFSTEEYTAASGLTATLLTYDWGNNFFSYDAYFRANGVRYTVSINGNVNDPEQTLREELIRILEAFTME